MKINPFDFSSNFEITDKGEKIFLPHGPFGSGYLIVSDKKWKNLKLIFNVYYYIALAVVIWGAKYGVSILAAALSIYWILVKFATVKAPLIKRRERYIVVVGKIARELTVTCIIIIQLLLLMFISLSIWSYFSGEKTWLTFAGIILFVMLFIHGVVIFIARIKMR